MRKHIATLSARVRTAWFGAEEGPDGLLARSFRDCDGCGENVYVLAAACRSCGAQAELLAG
ncbi:MAG: hypothetical protein ACRDQB_18080 [Thermocrispum sp.]